MSKLVKKAAKVAWEHNRNACVAINQLDDNIHHIKHYLDVNKNALPELGEVEAKELFVIMEYCISQYEKAQSEMSETNEWLAALAVMPEAADGQ